MNLLLLLSAMLTALSGAGLGVRAPQVPVAVNSVVTVAPDVQLVRPAVAGRRLAGLPELAASAVKPTAVGWQLTPAVPLYSSRRRE